MKSGFVAIIGRPNAGKSTLLNSLLDQKLAIITDKAQTTRNSILGIFNDDECQIVFVDTPGIHEAKTNLGTYMNKLAYSEANGADIIFYIVDGTKGLQNVDRKILDNLFAYEVPVFLLVNKVDEMNNELLLERLAYADANYDFKEIIPISALNKNNLDELLKVTKNYLNEGPAFFAEDESTTSSIEFQISEIIREKIILFTYEEIPHLCAVRVDEIKESDTKVLIEASIVVNKASHKGIVIGKGGTMLKKINQSASKDIKKLLNKKVILSLYVKVEEDWLNKEKQLFSLGYFNE